MIATIGYERATPEDFVATLQYSQIDILVDIRDRAQSRRRGFSKTQLATVLHDAGIEYLHLRALGDPKEGREAARAGRYAQFRKIFGEVMTSEQAQMALDTIREISSSKTVCLMCYERDPLLCHRKIVTDYFEREFGFSIMHLGVQSYGVGSGKA